MSRMRLLKDALAAVKEQDEHTALTTHAVRQLALEGKIKSVMIGRRRLINVDSLISFLTNGEPAEQPEETGKIRRVS